MATVARAISRTIVVIAAASLLIGCRELPSKARGGAQGPATGAPRETPQAAPIAPKATREVALQGSPFGVFYGLTTYRSRPSTQYMVELGADWTRQTLPWKGVEPQRNQFKWGTVDGAVSMVDAAARAGRPINVLSTFRTISPWAAARAPVKVREASVPPSDLQDYYRFVHATVKRARGRVRYWQVDNEVDSPFFWQGSAEEYVQLLRTAHRAIKDADPQAVVVAPGIQLWRRPMIEDEIAAGRDQRALDVYRAWAENNDEAKRAPTPSSAADLQRMFSQGKAATMGKHQSDFIRRLLDKDTAQYYDVLDIHIYHPCELIPDIVEWAQATMAREGYSKPIWLTETSGPNYPELWPNEKVGERRQAEEVVKRYVLALGCGVERVFWYVLVAPKHQDTGEWSRTGLLRRDLSKRPAYHSYRLMTQMLKGARSVRTLNIGSAVQAFEFTRPQGSIYVLWCDQGKTVRLPIGPCRLEIVDALGNQSTKETQGKEIEVQLSSTPIFVKRTALGRRSASLPGPTASADRHAEGLTADARLAQSELGATITSSGLAPSGDI
ncbi:MAG: hypothetical protein JSV79_00915 [Armatimonadota bacterium]|nr:MAG: hypothetical protein JSV79_00915 [Armatimonadota bacterium]